MDILYPRKDRRELPATPATMDRRLSQELVNRFVNAYAQFVFVGPHTGLKGPRGVVETLVNHDDHMHVRIYPASTGIRKFRREPAGVSPTWAVSSARR